MLDGGILTGHRAPAAPAPAYTVGRADAADRAAYDGLRRAEFVEVQRLFAGHDRDEADDDPRTVVLVARDVRGQVIGGVRVHPAPHPAVRAAGSRDLGWWRGSRLVVAPGARGARAPVAAALVRAACATAEDVGALRFDAAVQARHAALFTRLGWASRGAPTTRHGVAHVEMDWPVARVQRLVDATKAPLAGLLGRLAEHPLGGGGAGWVGDDAAPVPGAPLVAACDAILPSMVERDPEWAGWCAVLVNLNDLAAMGATPVGLLDAVGARDASFARRVLRGLLDAAAAWGVPVLGGHTQLGVPAALSVTALGATSRPVPGGGGRPGHALRLTADLGGAWRPGYTGTQWDSTTSRSPAELRATGEVVARLAPAAAKDVSMAGTVGTTGMLAEASGCRAVLDVAAVPAPDGVRAGDWLTCFPGFAVVTADTPGAPTTPLPDTVTSRVCGDLVEGAGVGLRWPDGVVTEAVGPAVTGLGAA